MAVPYFTPDAASAVPTSASTGGRSGTPLNTRNDATAGVADAGRSAYATPFGPSAPFASIDPYAMSVKDASGASATGAGNVRYGAPASSPSHSAPGATSSKEKVPPSSPTSTAISAETLPTVR